MESNKGTVAGILDITAGIFGFVAGIPLLVLAFGGATVLGMVPEPEANRMAFLPLVLFLPLAAMGFIAGLVAIFGGVAALDRRRWVFAVAASIAAVFSFFPVGVLATMAFGWRAVKHQSLFAIAAVAFLPCLIRRAWPGVFVGRRFAFELRRDWIERTTRPGFPPGWPWLRSLSSGSC